MMMKKIEAIKEKFTLNDGQLYRAVMTAVQDTGILIALRDPWKYDERDTEWPLSQGASKELAEDYAKSRTFIRNAVLNTAHRYSEKIGGQPIEIEPNTNEAGGDDLDCREATHELFGIFLDCVVDIHNDDDTEIHIAYEKAIEELMPLKLDMSTKWPEDSYNEMMADMKADGHEGPLYFHPEDLGQEIIHWSYVKLDDVKRIKPIVDHLDRRDAHNNIH